MVIFNIISLFIAIATAKFPISTAMYPCAWLECVIAIMVIGHARPYLTAAVCYSRHLFILMDRPGQLRNLEGIFFLCQKGQSSFDSIKLS